ncbi:MAG: hypothetical protein ABJC39_03070 [Chloroflexota bacterium]
MTPTTPGSAQQDAVAFTDRIMAAIAEMPLPTPTRNFTAALRAGALRDAGSAIVVAWHLATVRTWQVAPRVRARSIALVLAVATMLATGSLATAAAVRIVVPSAFEHDRVIERPGSGALVPETAEPTPERSPEPMPTAIPTDRPPAVIPPTVTDGTRHGGTAHAPAPDGDGDPAAHDGDASDGTTPDDHTGADDGDHAPAASDVSHETPEPDHASGGDAPQATPEPDSGSGGGDAPDPGGSVDSGGSSSPDE